MKNQNLGNLAKRGGDEILEPIIMRHDLQGNMLLQICNIFLVSHGFSCMPCAKKKRRKEKEEEKN